MALITKSFICLIALFSIVNFAQSQISIEKKPLSDLNSLSKIIPTKEMASVDVKTLLEEDKFESQFKDIPPRFGLPMTVNFGYTNSGTTEILPDGSKVWLVSVKSTGAISINLIFNKFYIPKGASFYVYNKDKSHMIGAFTDINNSSNKLFSTAPVKGDEIILEYDAPSYVTEKPEINVSTVIHAYVNIFNFLKLKSYGSSGACNRNVICPEGDPYRDQIRSAVMLLTSSNSRFCSGSMLNNARNDGTPFMLTANHCWDASSSTWIVMFKYEAPSCGNPGGDGPTNFTISGTTLCAKNAPSDFCLLRLSSKPPANYNVYYNGWNAINVPATNGFGVHHPAGDVKKISFSTTAYTPTSYNSPTIPGDSSHWHVVWASIPSTGLTPITEGGSSGSPIFNQNKQVVGQLHGGPSSCSASDKSDYYGKFDRSWTGGGTSATRLKDWLDSANTGIMQIGGFDANSGIVISHTPLGNTEQTTGTIPVNCTITPAGNNPSKTKLFFGKGGIYTDSLLMTNSSGINWTSNITLSGPGTYKYYITTADTLNNVATAPSGAPGNFYSFTSTPDIIPPVINHTQIGPTPKSFWPLTVSANVTDNIGVDSVWVMWYKNTPTIIEEFKLLPSGSNNYSALFNSINSDVNVGDVIYYKIMSDDISSNHNVASLPTSGYFSFGIINLQLCEGFNTATFPPTNWTITGTSTTYWSYNAVSGYGLGTGSASFNFYNLSSGSAQLTTLQFDPSSAGDSLKFVLAHAYYSTTYIDTLKIETSTNNGTNWTTIWTLWSQTNFTDPHSLSTVNQTPQFVPASGQWKSMAYLLPTGTNKIRFNAISGYGNDMFIDSTCIKSAPPAVLNFNLTAFLSGNYNGTNMVPDSVTVELHGATIPYALVESRTVLLNASGVGSPVYTTAVNGTPYYIVMKFNNGLETWSATPQTFTGSNLTYDFTTSATQAYGSNLIYVTNKWCVISGDANQDGSVDALDRSACWNDRNLSGVYVTDLNGDGVVDALDRSIAWNNRNLSVQKPALAANPNQELKRDKKIDKNNSKGTKDLKLDGSNAKKVKKIQLNTDE
jgi:hypothetical protein